LAAAIGLAATVTTSSADQAGYSYPPSGYYYCPDSPELIAREANAMSSVLSTISSPQRRDLLAEQWIQFAKQNIAKSMAFREQWLDLQKQQLQNQQDAQQARLDMLKMEGEIEKLRAANLRLQNENLQLQMQLKQTGVQASAPVPQPQPQPIPPQAQPTPGK
jgi:hypothetical protein